MGQRPRIRKRVNAVRHPVRRAPNGSAFQTCDKCGVSVAVALLDMHDCNMKKDVKRLKRSINVNGKKVFYEEPRSAFHFFMESFAKTCKSREFIEIDREAFQKWKNMSKKEQFPYFKKAYKVEQAYLKVIHDEETQLSQEKDDEADSAPIWKFSEQDYEDSESESYGSYIS